MAISTASGFSLGSSDPIDDRLVLTKAQMKTANDAVYPDVYIAVCKEDGSLYVYNKENEIDEETGKFRIFKSGGEITVDDEMSDTSENPVQNKVVNKAIIDNVFLKVENPSTYFSTNTGFTGCFIYTGEDKEWVYNNMGSSSTQSKQSTVNLIKNNLYCVSERKTIGTSSGSQLHCYSVLNMSSKSDSLKTMYDYGTIKDTYNFKNCASVVDLYNSIGGCLISVRNTSDVFPETNGVIILAYADSYKQTIYSTPVYTINMWFISTTGKMYICNDNSSTVSWNDSPYYIKPTDGISKTDLASDIQTSLGKADTSLQSETSLSKGTTSGSGNAVTDISVDGHKITLIKGSTFLTSHQDISGKLNLSGGTMTGALNAQKGLRVATSTPSTLVDGDIWIS